MELKRTKSALKALEISGVPNMSLVLSVMSALVKDVEKETKFGLHELSIAAKPGQEEGFINALDVVALELEYIMDEIEAGKMPEILQERVNTVLSSKEKVQKLTDTARKWKELEQICQELNQQIEEETKRLEEQQKRIAERKQKIEELNRESTDARLTEEECQTEIERLMTQLAEIPQTGELTERRRQLNGQRKRYSMVNQYISDYIDDHDERTRLAQKFAVSEEECRMSLKQVDQILGGLEQHYGKMLQFMEVQRIEREKEYAGN